jgi:hypothetical protein
VQGIREFFLKLIVSTRAKFLLRKEKTFNGYSNRYYDN